MLRAHPARGDFGDVLDAAWFLAVLVWPTDAKRRCEAVATWAAEMLGAVTEGGADAIRAIVREVTERCAGLGAQPYGAALAAALADAAPELARVVETGIRSRLFLPAGGYRAVAAAPGVDALLAEAKRTIETGAGVAGLALYVLAALERHHPEAGAASLNRALAVLEDTAPGRSLRALKQAWQANRGAAHVWAGLIAAFGANGDPTSAGAEVLVSAIETPEGRARVLGHAAWFQHWGASHVVPGAARPVLDVPVLIEVRAEPLVPAIGRLSADALSRARGYRAPKAF